MSSACITSCTVTVTVTATAMVTAEVAMSFVFHAVDGSRVVHLKRLVAEGLLSRVHVEVETAITSATGTAGAPIIVSAALLSCFALALSTIHYSSLHCLVRITLLSTA